MEKIERRNKKNKIKKNEMSATDSTILIDLQIHLREHLYNAYNFKTGNSEIKTATCTVRFQNEMCQKEYGEVHMFRLQDEMQHRHFWREREEEVASCFGIQSDSDNKESQ